MTKATRPALKDALSENILVLRQEMKLSQDELAFRAGMHRTYLSGIERRTRNVTLDIVERLADALQVEPWVLLTPRR